MRDIIESRIKLLDKAKNNIELQQVEIELCRRDILYFCRNYLYTDKNKNLFQEGSQVIPLIPFEFQEELITEVRSSIINGTKEIKNRTDLTNVFIEKSRQMGVSWIIMAIFVYGYVFHNHKYLVISQKESDVDKIGDIRSLLQKARFYLENMPTRMHPKGYLNQTGTKCNKMLSITREDGTGSITGESANPNAGRGGTYDATFQDEMGFQANASTINTALASATPCRIFNSTPNGEGNEFYRMRKLAVEGQIKHLRYHRSEHPKYDQNRYEWKIKGMTSEKIAQELEIDYNTAIIGRVYKDFPTETEVFVYQPGEVLYVFIDHSHGGEDPNAVILAQKDGDYIRVVDSVEVHRPFEDCAKLLSNKVDFLMTDKELEFYNRRQKYGNKKAVYIGDPYDSNSAQGSTTISKTYRKYGIQLLIPKNRDKKQQIQITKSNIWRIKYNDYCLDFASAILNARYPEIKENSSSTTSKHIPVHDWTSHYRTALEYGIVFMFENPEPKKKENKPVEKRNYITGEIIMTK